MKENYETNLHSAAFCFSCSNSLSYDNNNGFQNSCYTVSHSYKEKNASVVKTAPHECY